MSAVPARDASVGGCLQATVERRADGSTVLRSTEPLGWYPARLTDHLEQWAGEVPDRTFVARRGAAGRCSRSPTRRCSSMRRRSGNR